MSKTAEELRARIVRHIAKSASLTASQIAFDLQADLGRVKSGLKVLTETQHVVRRNAASGPPIFTLGPKGAKATSAYAPLTVQEAPRPKPRMSGANFPKGFNRSHDVIIERRSSRGKLASRSTGAPRARDVLCPDEIAGGRS